jgi:hypothetical protein
MIDHARRCIFVHIRKSAGTSVKALFPGSTEHYGNGILDPDWDETDPAIAGYVKFTVVRNPWDRFISGWRYCASTRQLDLHEVLEHLPREDMRENILSAQAPASVRQNYLEAFLKEECERRLFHAKRRLGIDMKIRPVNTGHDYRHLTRPQSSSFVHPDGRLAVDEVLYLEDLEAGLARVAERAGIALPPLPRRNRNDNRGQELSDYREIFDDRARSLFERAFGRDVALLGYDFDAGPQVPPRVRLT